MAEQRNHRTEELFGYATVVQHLESLIVDPPDALERDLVPLLAGAASNPPRIRSVSDVVMRAAMLGAAIALAGGGLAAADALPAPLQNAAESVLRTIGVEIGDPGDGGARGEPVPVPVEEVDHGDDATDESGDERREDEDERDDDGRESDDDEADDESRESDDDESGDRESDDDEAEDESRGSDDDEHDDESRESDDEPDDD